VQFISKYVGPFLDMLIDIGNQSAVLTVQPPWP
jgi:hypothetical protein